MRRRRFTPTRYRGCCLRIPRPVLSMVVIVLGFGRLNAAPSANSIHLQGATGSPGGTVSLCLLVTNGSPMKAFSASISHDQKLSIDAVELTATGLGGSVPCIAGDGTNPKADFFQAEQGSECVALGVVIDYSTENRACPPAADQRVATIRVVISPEASAGEELALTLGGKCGNLEKVSCLIVQDGEGSRKVCALELDLVDAVIQVIDEECPAPRDLVADYKGDAVDLSWKNPGLYSQIEVLRDGEVIAEIEGSATSYVDAGSLCGVHTYRVAGWTDCERTCTSASREIAITCFVRGDANVDGERDITDAITILGYLFQGSPAALQCSKSANMDDGDALDITDGVYLLSYLFQGGPEPRGPFPICGIDPSPDGLTCEFFSICPASE